MGIKLRVEPERVRSLRVPWWEDPADAERMEVPIRTQYAIRVRSALPIIYQYGRLELLPSYELYMTMGYVEPEGDVQ